MASRDQTAALCFSSVPTYEHRAGQEQRVTKRAVYKCGGDIVLLTSLENLQKPHLETNVWELLLWIEQITPLFLEDVYLY